MPFMVHAALKAKSLNSCPGETNCRNAWHDELRDVFQRKFSFSRDLTCRASQQNQPYSLMCTGKQSMYSKTFGIFSGSVLCSAVYGPKEKAAACFMFPPFSHLEDPGHSLLGFLLSTIFSAYVFIYYTIYCCQNGPTVLFAPYRLTQ